jgi:hypothetical protein
MLTALLLLLGLSGAGAGLYSVLKEAPKSKDSSSGSSSPSKGSISRAGSEFSKAGEIKSRGKQTNFGGKSPTSKEIEEDSPAQKSEKSVEQLPLGEYGSGSSRTSPDVESVKSPEDFAPLGSPEVSYTADEIISKNSKFSHHRRPLLNAEALVDKKDVEGALEIYQRTENRIPDEEIKSKLKQNIEDLKNYKKKKEALEDLFNPDPEEDPEEYKDRLESLRPSSPIPIRDLAEAIREIAEALGETLQRGFYPPFPIPAQAMGQPPQIDPKASKPQAQQPYSQVAFNLDNLPPIPDSGFERQLPPNYFPAPIVYQVISAPGEPFQAKHQPQQPESFLQPTIQAQPHQPQQYPKQPIPDEEEFQPLDLPEDTFFTRDWDKFKDLPLTDRRSGKERRQNKDRRTGANRKDRRSGEDRRKHDLFKEREEYLKKKSDEKKAIEGKGEFPDKNLSDRLEPFYPPPSSGLPQESLPLLQIDLPAAEDTNRRGEPTFTLTQDTVELTEIGLPDPEILQKESGEPFPELPSSSPVQKEVEVSVKETAVKEEDFSLPNIGLPDSEELRREMGQDGPVLRPPVLGDPEQDLEDLESPEIEIVDGDLDDQLGEIEPAEELPEEEKEPEKILHGILELKPPEIDDAPFLTMTYDFGKIPHGFRLSKNYSIMEYSYYKYKPMLMKAQEFARRKMLKNALNYYRVVKSQNIPPEMRKMINRNIQDITEFMEKFLMAKG